MSTKRERLLAEVERMKRERIPPFEDWSPSAPIDDKEGRILDSLYEKAVAQSGKTEPPTRIIDDGTYNEDELACARQIGVEITKTTER